MQLISAAHNCEPGSSSNLQSFLNSNALTLKLFNSTGLGKSSQSSQEPLMFPCKSLEYETHKWQTCDKQRRYFHPTFARMCSHEWRSGWFMWVMGGSGVKHNKPCHYLTVIQSVHLPTCCYHWKRYYKEITKYGHSLLLKMHQITT